ncbi:MAG: tRNA lysidine(34) synthetase TilS [Caulobacteraceae bacterium]|nr:tRNA lysidine(34) synthetase TilS [Caulobacteraceae bacterium]
MIAVPDSFDRRLSPDAAGPIAAAFSGGGDSLMALKLTKAWADRNGRQVIALTVDHGLQPASAAWTRAAGAAAERLGVEFRALAWLGDRPRTGLAAAARAARHALIAGAAREAGARVVVFGHTADDVIEAAVMRGEGLRIGAPREWSPSPAWPAGRGLFLLRPLLGLRRAAIRKALAAGGERWIDDPANEDPASPRARARPLAARQSDFEPACGTESVDEAVRTLARRAAIDEAGAIRLSRPALARTPEPAALRRVLGAALTCAGGRPEPPRSERLEALTLRLRAGEPFAATLAGAKLTASDGEALIVRDAGEFRRAGLAALDLPALGQAVWDGRFEIMAGGAPGAVRPLVGHMKALPNEQSKALRRFAPDARRALPRFVTPAGIATCPILAGSPYASAKSLVTERFFSACGVYTREPAT